LPSIPNDVTGKNFSRILGKSNPLLEIFILDKKLKGPSWLSVANIEKVNPENQQSYCKFEVRTKSKSLKDALLFKIALLLVFYILCISVYL